MLEFVVVVGGCCVGDVLIRLFYVFAWGAHRYGRNFVQCHRQLYHHWSGGHRRRSSLHTAREE